MGRKSITECHNLSGPPNFVHFAYFCQDKYFIIIFSFLDRSLPNQLNLLQYKALLFFSYNIYIYIYFTQLSYQWIEIQPVQVPTCKIEFGRFHDHLQLGILSNHWMLRWKITLNIHTYILSLIHFKSRCSNYFITKLIQILSVNF